MLSHEEINKIIDLEIETTTTDKASKVATGNGTIVEIAKTIEFSEASEAQPFHSIMISPEFIVIQANMWRFSQISH